MKKLFHTFLFLVEDFPFLASDEDFCGCTHLGDPENCSIKLNKFYFVDAPCGEINLICGGQFGF